MKIISRRNVLKTAGLAAFGYIVPGVAASEKKTDRSKFEYCLNAATIKEQAPGILNFIEIASRAGYDSVELWESNVRNYLKENNSLKSLKKYIDDNHIKVASACGISFAPWMVDDEEESKAGLLKMENVMNLFAELGCRRIIVTLSGIKSNKPVDLFKVGERYSQLLETGRKTGVMPHIEFLGGSKICSHIGQAFLVLATSNDPDGRIVADIFHIFKSGADFNGLKMVNGRIIEMVHMNDFTGAIPVENQSDQNRIYPGDGIAPMHQIINDLKSIGGTKVLSLELFNKEYWKQDPVIVAKTGIEKMKKVVSLA
jgi:2-keto-myo-inositol isomerase